MLLRMVMGDGQGHREWNLGTFNKESKKKKNQVVRNFPLNSEMAAVVLLRVSADNAIYDSQQLQLHPPNEEVLAADHR